MSFSKIGRSIWRTVQNVVKPSLRSAGTINGRVPELPSASKHLVTCVQNVNICNFAAKARRDVVNQFLNRSRRRLPLYGFVGFCMIDIKKHEHDEKPDLSFLFQAFQGGFVHKMAQEDDNIEYPSKIEDYKIHERLGKPSCFGAVYNASHRNKKVAVKMMFNADPRPNASTEATIMKKFKKEYSLLKSADEDSSDGLPKHPNIVKVLKVFVDDTKLMSDSMKTYPCFLPKKFNPDGDGRNKTMFMVMEKYPNTLQSYLEQHQDLSFEKRLHLSCQLMEAVAHLEKHQVCHRDLKADNILIDDNLEYPRLVLTDFGSSFDGNKNGMKLLYQTDDLDKGGNPALMAPEILNAKPGTYVVLNYEKADAWAVGSVVYQIFGRTNPLYEDNGRDIPLLRSGNNVLDLVVKLLMQENPDNRLSATMASNILTLLYYEMYWFWCLPACVAPKEQLRLWLLEMSFKCYISLGNDSKDYRLYETFAARTTPDEVIDSTQQFNQLILTV